MLSPFVLSGQAPAPPAASDREARDTTADCLISHGFAQKEVRVGSSEAWLLTERSEAMLILEDTLRPPFYFLAIRDYHPSGELCESELEQVLQRQGLPPRVYCRPPAHQHVVGKARVPYVPLKINRW